MTARLPLILVLTCVSSAAAQSSAGVTIQGRVLAADNGAALPRVRVGPVSAAPAGRAAPALSVYSDDMGRFVISGPPAALATLQFSKAGYATQRLPAPPAGRDVEVRLTRSAAVTGRVLDADGEPAVAATVTVARAKDDGTPDAAASFTTEVDDRGEYRVGALAEGRYVVQARNGAAGEAPTAPVPIVVRPGDAASGINFIVPLRVDPVRRTAAGVVPAAGTGVIRGRITRLDGGPLAGALVTTSAPGVPGRWAQSAADGRYEITGLAAGEYAVQATRIVYDTRQYGQQGSAPSTTRVVVRDGGAVDGIDVTLSRGAAVEGTIVDEHGEPLEGVAVRLMQLRYALGRTLAGGSSTGQQQTDDRGRFRIFGAEPGSYVLTAMADAVPSTPDGRGYPPIYAPGTTRIGDAVPIVLERGRETPGVDLVYAASPTVTVSGRAVDSAGAPLNGSVVLTVSQRSGGIIIEPRPIATTDGTFAIPNVPPGDYVVQAIAARRPAAGARAPATPELAVQFLTVGERPPAPLALRTSPGATLSGRIVLEGAQGGDVSGVQLSPFPTDFDFTGIAGVRPPVRVDSTGTGSAATFSMGGLYGPLRFMISSRDSTWYLRSITIAGRDVTDAPFDFGAGGAAYTDGEVVISTAAASIAGRVVADRGRLENAAVVVFPTDRDKRYFNSRFLRSARPSPDGSFRVTHLPPGDYWVAAGDGIVSPAPGLPDWQRPELMDALTERARRVTVAEGETVTVDLPVVRP